MPRLAPFIVLIATATLEAQQLEFRWTDDQGQPRIARRAEDVPRAGWRMVSVDVHGTEATSGDRFRTAEGANVVIEGIQAPALDEDGTAVSFGGARARARLADLINQTALTLE